MKYTVSLSYNSLPDSDLVTFTGTIITNMSALAEFKNPPVPLTPSVPPDPNAPTDVQTLQTTFADAIEAAADGGTALTAAKNAARIPLLAALDQLAFFVQGICRYNLSLLLQSGFLAASTNRAQTPLPTPSIVGIDNDSSTELDVHVSPLANAYSYEVQTSIGAGNWTTVATSTQARTITLTGLTTGTTYNVRVRGIGGSTGYSDWSLPVPRIVT
ncbi:MAG TPA: fibronectin type III domain-containing protein [Verrucomicrobiae bacterium]|nr:fibronectin type III domain-containing protein [Verrucomicrobiae bacterium]